jgi:hypothetical protein
MMMRVKTEPCCVGLADIKADIGDLSAHVVNLSLKIDSLLTDYGTVGSIRDVMCEISTGTLSADLPINPVCRQFVDDSSYQEPVHELKDILRTRKPPRGKAIWR